jgi:hypothetical protein
MWVIWCDQPGTGAAAWRRTYFGGPRWWTSDRRDAARWLDQRSARYVMEMYCYDHRRSTARHDYIYGLEQVDDSDRADRAEGKGPAMDDGR